MLTLDVVPLVMDADLPLSLLASLPPQNAFSKSHMGTGGKTECPIHAFNVWHTFSRLVKSITGVNGHQLASTHSAALLTITSRRLL